MEGVSFLFPKPDEPEPKGKATPRPCGQIWMIRRFTSAQLFPQSAGASKRTIQVQAITAHEGWHLWIATDFFAESIKSQAIRD
jgi:hypothetical protein